MFTISYWFNGTNHQADASFETQAKAVKAAKALPENFTDVTVWNGMPGELPVATINARCDAERFGDSCEVCAATA